MSKTRIFLFLMCTAMCIKPAIHGDFRALAASVETPSAPVPPPVFGASRFTLANGLQVIVIPNHRAPVVTHMMWIRAGAADEPESDSGIAHYLEHLMFKGTPTVGPGEYSRRIALMGGNENAFTGQDYTAYFVTIAPEHLPDVMELERDRLLHLAPPEAHVKSELAVVIEERRQRTENDPLGALQEQMNAYLFASTPYDNPVIGWMDDMKRMTWSSAQAFKNKWYVPGNMMLVISGDVTVDAIKTLSDKYYGDLPASPVPARDRLTPPAFPAATTLQFRDPNVEQPQVMMAWRAPGYRMDHKNALTLSVLEEVMDGGAATRMYQDLVVTKKRATGINFSYDDTAWNDGSLWISGTPAAGVTLPQLHDDIIKELDTAAQTITPAEVKGAIERMQRQAIFARDSVAGPAMIIGQSLATGATLDEIETWPQQIATVTADDVRGVIKSLLRCNTGPACQPPLVAYVQGDGKAHSDPHAPAPAPRMSGGLTR